MEPLGIIVGTILGALVSLFLTLLRFTRGKMPEARITELEQEMSRLRADVEDQLDKASHLHDRIRKRHLVVQGESAQQQAGLDGQPLDRKAQLRQRLFAARLGSIRGTTR